jgi:hypothetical protein
MRLPRKSRSKKLIFLAVIFKYADTFVFSRQKRSSGNEELSPEVIDRLHYLELMKKDLERGTDENKQIPNIKAILKAYRTLQLDWNSGLVTYWSNGVQICQPRPFDWDEFEAINLVYNGKEGFWTEGVSAVDEPSR